MAVTTTYTLDTIANDFQANGYASFSETRSEVTMTAGGGFAVVYGSLSGTFNVPLVSFFAPGETALSGALDYQVPYDDPAVDVDMIGSPEIITLANGHVAVIWDSATTNGGDIRGAILDPASGAVVNADFEVSQFQTDTDPEALALTGGNWVVAMANSNNVYLQVMSSVGAQIGAQITINASAAGTERDPVLTPLTDGGFVVVWTLNDTSTVEDAVWASVRNADGSVRVAPFEIGFNGAGNDNEAPAVAALQNGNWAVVYKDSGWGGDGLTLQIFDPAGANVGVSTFIRVDTDSAAIERDPDITVLSNGFIAVTWTHPFSATDDDIFVKIYDQTGNQILIGGSSDPGQLQGGGVDTFDAAITALLDDQFVATWTQEDGDSAGYGIRGDIRQLTRTQTSDGAGDTLTGDSLRDILNGNGGDDTLNGRGGRDLLYGGDDDDVADGGDGNDTVYGGNGNDLLRGDEGFDLLYGGDGDDRFFGNGSDDTAYGGAGNDTVTVGTGDALDVAYGGDDTDTLEYAGTTGSIVFDMTTGDFVYEGSAVTVLGFENFNDASGNGTVTGTVDANAIDGGGGKDTLSGGAGNDQLNGGAQGDKLFGDAGDDLLNGGGARDRLEGGAGHDDLQGGAGRDFANAGAGDDTVSGSGGRDKLLGDTGDDDLSGGTGNDVLDGGANIDDLLGGNGRDRLFGGLGGDTLDGGRGNDTLDGGGGADVFVFAIGGARDRVTFFDNGTDRVDLQGFGIGAINEIAIGGGVRLTVDGQPGLTLDLLGVSTAQIDAGDFV